MTNHAKERASARGIDKSDIERVINHPTETIQDAYNGNFKSFGEIVTESRYLIIVHTEFNKYVKVITVLMTDKGGIKADGFSKI